MNSGSFARGGQPRSVPDPDGDAYDEMIRQHKAHAGSPEHHPTHQATQPHLPASLLDKRVAILTSILNEPRLARQELEHGHPVRAVVDAVAAAADIEFGRRAIFGALKGQVKIKGPHAWRTKPWEEGRGAREWMGDKGFVAKGQHAHHALIPNNGWGKHVPDWFKNQPANIKPMKDAVTHTRIHSASRKAGLPRFNAVERYLHGTPTWWKAANGAAIGHGAHIVQTHTAQGHHARETPHQTARHK
jgi:hypothetical protein